MPRFVRQFERGERQALDESRHLRIAQAVRCVVCGAFGRNTGRSPIFPARANIWWRSC